MTDLSTYIKVLTNLTSAAVVSVFLEWVFPNPVTEPSKEHTWIELIGVIFELSLYIDLAPSLASFIAPEYFEEIPTAYDIAFVMGIFMMPNMLRKFNNWYNSLQWPTGGLFDKDQSQPKSCSGCE